ncbi:MAG: lasso peptide biosynthesis B2 protein [Candidatus Schekmanbacteria bacterium]|nr:MAG: lasso peptide biosynthesis B2 protein [Candidatus Schekmanbacteria bacterium]
MPGIKNEKTPNRIVRRITEFVIYSKIFLLATILPLLLKVLSLPSVMKILTPSKNRRHWRQWKVDIIVKGTDKILGIGFFIYHPTCLKKSLILYHFLRKEGMDVAIHFGVRKRNGTLDGHSWLTKKGKRVYDNLESVDDFFVTYSYPSDESFDKASILGANKN